MLRTISLAVALTVLSACGGKNNHIGPVAASEGLSNALPVVADGPYVDVLKACISADEIGESCTVATLPPLGMDTASTIPTVDEIMTRVVVSHPWMAERFREMLVTMPEDVRRLMQAVTAVVIDDDIRPSFYWQLTGAIYLDPEYLWLTAEERSVINPAPDYRTAFDDLMAFRAFGRYVRNGRDALAALGSTEERRLADIELPLAALLFHELAHANDILPPSSYVSINTSASILDATSDTYSVQPSTQLWMTSAPQSMEMARLAGILFLGETPTAAETELTAVQVGELFASDRTNDDYAYTSQYEDLAMLFEEAMMKIHYSADRDLAFVAVPDALTACDDWRIGWGQRNRIGDTAVKVRAQWVVDQLLPGNSYDAMFDGFPAPQSLREGSGWCESLQMAQPAFERGARPFVEQMPLPAHHLLPRSVVR